MIPEDPNLERPPVAPRDTVQDRRVRPRGVLPRHLQTWIMAGLAATMLVIIVVTGRPTPPRRPTDAGTPQTGTSPLPPDRLRRYQEQLAEQESRLRQELADRQAAVATATQAATSSGETQPADPIVEEQRRRAYTSLFAENVAFTRRPVTSPATVQPRQATDLQPHDSFAAVVPSSTQAAAPPPQAPANGASHTGNRVAVCWR